MEQCQVCGRSYGVTHSCPGPVNAQRVGSTKWPVPVGFAPGHYFRQAVAIARLDDGAVMAASLDENALMYGASVWVLGQIFILLGALWAAGVNLSRLDSVAGLFVVVRLLSIDAILILAQLGICHLLARLWFGARGTYFGVLRPLLLGFIVTWLGVIPVVGILIVGLWSIAVMMIVFEDVDGIGRLKAFGLSLVIGLLCQAAMRSLFVPG